ncbi:MAG: SufD family Fe-S cluster assembly protein [Pseudomonadota bacterium]
MEHWGGGMEVYAYGDNRIRAGSRSQATLMTMAPVANHVSRSRSTHGADTNAVNQAIVFSADGTKRVIETETILTGAGARTKDIAHGHGRRGDREQRQAGRSGARDVRFFGCDGLKLTGRREITALPTLQALVEGAMLSHGASMGMNASEKLNHPIAAGKEEDKARDLIVQGFLSLDSAVVPSRLRARPVDLIAKAESGGM